MTEKHYPYCGGSFDRIIFDKDGSVWVPEAENAKLRELVRDYDRCIMHADCDRCEYDGKLSTHCPLGPCFPDIDELRELGIEVDA